MNSFKLISKDGSFCSVMHRILQEPNTTGVTFISGGDCAKVYDNIIPKVKTPIELDIQPSDVVLFDASGAGSEADTLKSKGYVVIGAGGLNDSLELDRAFGLQFLTRHGVKIPPSFTFQDFAEVEKFLRKAPERYVFKPSGNPSLSLTYVAPSPENMIGMLPYLRRETEKHACKEFVLQQVMDGVEMSTEAWFNGEHFILPLNSTFEEKKFMDGGHGPQTGCMGSVMWNWSPMISEKLYQLLFREMEEELAQAKYLGPLDINAIWTPSGPYALELTPRFGFDAIQGFLRTLSVPPGEFLAMFHGLEHLPVNDSQLSLAVAISTPPYPSSPEAREEVPAVPILGLSEKDLLDTVYGYDFMFDPELGMYSTTGAYNWALSVTDNGESFGRLLSSVYKTVERIEVADKQYRMDVGERFKGDLQKVLSYLAHYS